MVYIGIAAAIFIGDLWIKNHMERWLADGKEKKRLKGLLLFRLHHNRGAVLNAGQKKRPVVAALSVLLVTGVAAAFVLSLGRGNRMLKTGLSMLLGGGFSNTYDRLRRKHVVDYFSFGFGGKRFSRIVFNLSDFGIIIGAVMAALAGTSS